jgi:hypothetical protein
MNIINYNATAFEDNLNQSLIKDISVYNRLKKNNFGDRFCLIDRTQSIPHFLDIDYSYSPIPNDINFNLDFHTVTKNRCIELLSLGKQINVSWSGGLDSTYILFSLYNYANDKSQIKVYGTYNSIIESGDLFDRFIKNKINYTITPNYTSFSKCKYNEENCIYVTGSMSNQLFVPGLTFNIKRDPILKPKKYQMDGVSDVYNETLYKISDLSVETALTDECLQFLEPLIQNSVKPINTIQDLRWYLNFNCYWYNVLTNAYVGLEKDKINRIHAFFNTDEFQLWAITNKDPVTKTGDYSDERWQIREAISDYIGDSYFSKNKKKFTSVLSPLRSNWLYLSNDYSTVFYDASKNTK